MWVSDYRDRYVNLSRWDYIDWQTITDNENGNAVGEKIYLIREDDEYILGYIDLKNQLAEEVIESIVKGVNIHLLSIEGLIYNYMDEEFGKIGISNYSDFHDEYVRRMKIINDLIGKRFVEEE